MAWYNVGESVPPHGIFLRNLSDHNLAPGISVVLLCKHARYQETLCSLDWTKRVAPRSTCHQAIVAPGLTKDGDLSESK
jgi:hypothetical protein